MLESVATLRQSLRSLGSDLMIGQGKPEDIIPELVKQLQVSAVYYHAEVTSEELAVAAALKTRLDEQGVLLKSFWGHTLYHPDDLPFDPDNVPEVYTQFRKQVEKKSKINPTVSSPSHLRPLPNAVEVGRLPTLTDLGFKSIDLHSTLRFHGGEAAGMERLGHYF